ncbi:Metallo-beta-lactamase family protein [Caenispirillum salinarum AK4]|uniref:Metallo-beta-lactamase family protein n=1 Tax=Caenispirillum salinarum AK4 TaxID=1238182 RepID=K9HUM7_9PROT|nr:MBL fold metallo-hydrolase [Caenispirillum salinarum]EKV31961.1 Metallo-beta-lactamase family protein [Caenispirillum salinarum AK4]
MFIEKVKSEGLAHLSYVVGGGVKAAVIDPRRDCEDYIRIARDNGATITHIIETHRNEDYVSGAPVLAGMTGARVLHGPHADADIPYAETAPEGTEVDLGGGLRLRVLETPGHTHDSLSIAVYDDQFGQEAVGVFTGDALFIGDVGRTDFYPDEKEAVAGQLFDSLRKILDLGDQAILYPAHGAGSVCGSGMADREFSTLGYERLNNPMLKITDRDGFIRAKVNEHHDYPPYFRHMEHLNSVGLDRRTPVGAPRVLTADAMGEAGKSAILLDVRPAAAWLGAHVPGSLAVAVGMVPAFAGWLLAPEDDIVLIAEDAAMAEAATLHLARIGYDRVAGFFPAGMTRYAATARPFEAAPVVDVAEVEALVADPPADWTLLDVRSDDEAASAGLVPGATQIYVGELPARLDELPRDRRYTVMCGSGARATVAASVLARAGYADVGVFLGSMQAWLKRGDETV